MKMADLSDFKKGQIFGTRMAGASVTTTAEFVGVARSTVLKVMTAFEKEGKKLLTEAKLWKKVSQKYSSENYSRTLWPSREPSFLKNCKKGAAQSRISLEGCKQKIILK